MKKKYAITLGTFDGVHIGHQYLFAQLDRFAARHRLCPKVLYFPLPPRTLLSQQPEMTVLTLPLEKKQLLKHYAMPANALDFALCRRLSPHAFWKQLKEKYQMGGLLIGPDFAFGKDRSGSVDFLRLQCKKENIPFEVVSFYQTGQEKISSSLIRKTLASGNIPSTTALLGRPYELTGTVIKGHKLGRKLGFPTANLDTGIYKILPLGVFAVKVRVGRKRYDGFCNIGFRPTVNTLNTILPLVEVHIFDFNQSIYGRKITIWFMEKLRDEMKFNGLEELTRQLHTDRTQAKTFLKNCH